MNKLTKEQVRALYVLYQRSHDGAKSFLEFRRRGMQHSLMDCFVITWCGMWVGIEKDGHTHS